MRVYIYYCEWDGKNNSHDLLKRAVCQYLKETQKTACDQYNRLLLSIARDQENGKPYFKDMPGLHFSISHSGIIWSCAFSDGEVGLDLQALHERNCEKIARRFYHPMEIRWLESNGFHQFSRLWAYKESYVKYTGDGLINGLDYFSVITKEFLNEKDMKSSLLGQAENSVELGAEGVFQQEVSFQDNYWMVVTSGDRAQVVLKELNMERK